jgi:hypothetical protein
MPEGLVDRSPFRTHVDCGAPAPELALRIDRVLSPWRLQRVEETLVGTAAFEAGSLAPREDRAAARSPSQRLLLGSALGESADGSQELRMEYAILDLGAEKLVARYVGAPEAVALNEGVLRDSLRSLQGQAVQAGDHVPVEAIDWSGAEGGARVGAAPLPAGWVIEPGRPSVCAGLAQPGAVASASAPRDLSVVLRAGAWTGGGVEPAAAAAACSSRRGSVAGASYVTHESRLGIAYRTEGVFLQTGPGQTVQMEVVSADQDGAYAAALLASWVKRVAR